MNSESNLVIVCQRDSTGYNENHQLRYLGSHIGKYLGAELPTATLISSSDVLAMAAANVIGQTVDLAAYIEPLLNDEGGRHTYYSAIVINKLREILNKSSVILVGSQSLTTRMPGILLTPEPPNPPTIVPGAAYAYDSENRLTLINTNGIHPLTRY